MTLARRTSLVQLPIVRKASRRVISNYMNPNLVSDAKVVPRSSSLCATNARSDAFLDWAETELKSPHADAPAAEHKPYCKDAPLNEYGSQSPGKPKCDPVKHPLGCGFLFGGLDIDRTTRRTLAGAAIQIIRQGS